jgi:hypothetical protein
MRVQLGSHHDVFTFWHKALLPELTAFMCHEEWTKCDNATCRTACTIEPLLKWLPAVPLLLAGADSDVKKQLWLKQTGIVSVATALLETTFDRQCDDCVDSFVKEIEAGEAKAPKAKSEGKSKSKSAPPAESTKSARDRALDAAAAAGLTLMQTCARRISSFDGAGFGLPHVLMVAVPPINLASTFTLDYDIKLPWHPRGVGQPAELAGFNLASIVVNTGSHYVTFVPQKDEHGPSFCLTVDMASARTAKRARASVPERATANRIR